MGVRWKHGDTTGTGKSDVLHPHLLGGSGHSAHTREGIGDEELSTPLLGNNHGGTEHPDPRADKDGVASTTISTCGTNKGDPIKGAGVKVDDTSGSQVGLIDLPVAKRSSGVGVNLVVGGKGANPLDARRLHVRTQSAIDVVDLRVSVK